MSRKPKSVPTLVTADELRGRHMETDEDGNVSMTVPGLGTSPTAKRGKNGAARPKRMRQESLPELAPPSIPELDEAIANYQDLKSERIELLARELVERDVVADLMRKHGVTTYRTADGSLIASFEEKVKVKRAKDDEADEDD